MADNDHSSSENEREAFPGELVFRYQNAIDRGDTVVLSLKDLDKIIGSISILALSVDLMAEALNKRTDKSEKSDYLINLASKQAIDASKIINGLTSEIMKRVDRE